MSDVNKEMQNFALEIKEEATRRGYMVSVCLADGLGHGEFYHNAEEVEYSMIRIIEKKGKTALHFKSYMKTEPVKTNKCVNALAVMADIVGYNAMNFIEFFKHISARIEIEKEEGKDKEGKIIPYNKPSK